MRDMWHVCVCSVCVSAGGGREIVCDMLHVCVTCDSGHTLRHTRVQVTHARDVHSTNPLRMYTGLESYVIDCILSCVPPHPPPPPAARVLVVHFRHVSSNRHCLSNSACLGDLRCLLRDAAALRYNCGFLPIGTCLRSRAPAFCRLCVCVCVCVCMNLHVGIRAYVYAFVHWLACICVRVHQAHVTCSLQASAAADIDPDTLATAGLSTMPAQALSSRLAGDSSLWHAMLQKPGVFCALF